MAYGSLLSDVVQSSVVGTPPQFNDGGGTQVGTLCRAWVNYKGTATRAINSSFNVSSVTFVSTGIYTINFTTALSDANYAAVVGADNGSGATLWCCTSSSGAAPTTSAFRVQSFNTSVTLTDAPLIQVAVFR
jgi:hypothetical protein